ncbi:hypothetical protein [uncultured Winogradskyella sp.]|uniref:hypothetical protein n=1 Tax=uncultured Winogradskyella sp. TaxID=395353 RepID=UPI002635E518|nr:hypothetical protein [uncultured Winogradskyella sp.]
MIVKCSYCNKDIEKQTGHVNRAIKNGNNIYCNRKCSGLGRRNGKSKEQLKEEKRLYDKKYRENNLEKLKAKKKAYYDANAKEIYKRNRVKKDNDEARAKHAEYCRRPDQREKEKINRYKRVYGEDWQIQTKFCISCEQTKHIFEFESFPSFPDGRRHICNECEKYQNDVLKYSTKAAMQTMVSRRYTKLTRWDISKHPYLIEAFKFSILLNKITR